MSELRDFYSSIRGILSEARQKAYSAVNFAMVEAYWHIGRRIVEQEQQGQDRGDNENARNFYLKECAEQKWSSRVLERNINSFYFERLLSTEGKQGALQAQTKFKKDQPRDFIKDPYELEFLGLPESPWPKEQAVETAIIANLQDFLLEMGRGFSFVGRQFRISSETKHFYIDKVDMILVQPGDIAISGINVAKRAIAVQYRHHYPAPEWDRYMIE